MIVKIFILLCSHSGAWPACMSSIHRCTLHDRWLGSTEANNPQAMVIATAYIPNSHLLRIAERSRGQSKRGPYLPPAIADGVSRLHMWMQNYYSPASESTY